MDRVKVISSTGEKGSVPRDQLEAALSAGYQLDTSDVSSVQKPTLDSVRPPTESTRVDVPKTNGRAYVVDTQTGEKGSIDAGQLNTALMSGYRLESPAEQTVRQYVDKNKGIAGTTKVLAGQFVDEALMGVPELAYDLTSDPIARAKKDALKDAHPLANAVGGITGAGASLLYGGPLIGKASTTVAEKLVANRLLQVGGDYTAKRAAAMVARDVLGSAAKMGTEGALYSSPQAATYVLLGHPDEAGEKLAYSVVGGVLAGTLAAPMSVAKRGAEVAQGKGVRNLAGMVNSEDAIDKVYNESVRTYMKADPTLVKLLDAADNPKLIDADLVRDVSDLVQSSPTMRAAITDIIKNNKGAQDLTKKLTSMIGQGSNYGSFAGVLNMNPKILAASVVAGVLKQPIANTVSKAFNPLNQLQFGTNVLAKIAQTQEVLGKVPLQAATGRAVASTFTPMSPDEYEQTVHGLNALTPEQVTDVFKDFPIDDDTKERATARLGAILKYGRENIPIVPPPAAFTKGTRLPSPQQLYKFGRTMQLMNDPAEFKRRVEANTLTAGDVTDMESMYPELLNQFRQMMMNEYAKTPVNVPYSVRMKLNLLMGNRVKQQDVKPYQDLYQSADPKPKSNVNISPDSLATPTDQMLSRK